MQDVNDGSRLQEVRATFADSERMQAAVGKLTVSGFDRADLSLPASGHSLDERLPEAASKPVQTDADAQQVRTLGSSTAATAAAMAAAGVAFASGVGIPLAVAGAAVAGGAAGGLTFAATSAGNQAEQTERDARASTGGLELSVRTRGADKVEAATAILRNAGATHVETIIEETR